jgi:3-oxoacyl-[acyl-carrier-protein] synthase-3
MAEIYSVITGTGSFIPSRKVSNSDFMNHTFLDANGTPFDKNNKEIIEKFAEITGIRERRYASDDMLASDMATEAAIEALDSAGLSAEKLDHIIVAHNFGDVSPQNNDVDIVPSLASRVKQKLKISNPSCVAYDLPFGCPGWLQGVIQSNYYLRSGDASACLIIGAETLSRVCDPHDRDSMIYADGAGATILQSYSSDTPTGILSHATRTDAEEQAFFLRMEPSYNPECDDKLYLKMDGRKLYQYALKNVPSVVKTSLEKARLTFSDVDKILIHQANAKMDAAIVQRLAKLYDVKDIPKDLVPMTISWLGNSSVATIPTLLDLLMREKLDGHQINSEDNIVLSSVGAGMNINSVVYKMG